VVILTIAQNCGSRPDGNDARKKMLSLMKELKQASADFENLNAGKVAIKN
jgi:hypothetical protein